MDTRLSFALQEHRLRLVKRRADRALVIHRRNATFPCLAAFLAAAKSELAAVAERSAFQLGAENPLPNILLNLTLDCSFGNPP